MSAFTPYNPVSLGDELVVWNDSAATGDAIPSTDISTHTGQSLFGRFGAFAAPIAVVVSLFAPAPPAVFRRTSAGSATNTIDVQWQLDDVWIYTEARITQAEIDSLNALLDINMSEDRSFGLTDDV
jgi:hypothetical protein